MFGEVVAMPAIKYVVDLTGEEREQHLRDHES
jgi:hypothetical protein